MTKKKLTVAENKKLIVVNNNYSKSTALQINVLIEKKLMSSTCCADI